MKKNILAVLFVFLFLFNTSPAFSGDLADKALLEILESKGFLTEKEVGQVKAILKAEQKNERRQEEKGVEIIYDEGLRINSKDRKRFTPGSAEDSKQICWSLMTIIRLIMTLISAEPGFL